MRSALCYSRSVILCVYCILFFLERAARSALTKYTVKSLVYVSTTNIYLEYIGYMFRPVNRSSSSHRSNKSKVLLRYWDPNIYNYIQYKIWYWLKYIVKLKPLKHELSLLIKIYCQIKTVKTWVVVNNSCFNGFNLTIYFVVNDNSCFNGFNLTIYFNQYQILYCI